MRIPRFKTHLTIQVQDPDVVFFVSETGHRALRGRLVYLLAPLIDGRRTRKEITQTLRGEFAASDIELGLLLLASEGLLTDTTGPGSATDIFRDSWDVDPRHFQNTLKSTTVRILSIGESLTEPFAEALSALGIRTGGTGNFTVVITDDYLRNELEEFNRAALKQKMPWMLMKPSGKTVWFGPVFRPMHTACWNCLALRLRENRPLDMLLNAPAVPSLMQAAFHLGAIHTLQHLVLPQKDAGNLVTLDVKDWAFQKHRVSRLDNCTTCGPATAIHRAKRISLKSCRKTYTNDGGHRLVSAEVTFEQYQHHISPLTGIVDAVELYGRDNNGLAHSYVAGHLFVPRLQKENLLENGLKQISAGKGITTQQARTSALCEALERYSGVFRGTEPRIHKSFRELGEKAIHPNLCMIFSEQQYQARNAADAPREGHNRAPEPLPEDTRIHWSPLWSLTESKFKYLPSAYCYYGFPHDQEFCRSDSNGNAAGNTIEEAILQGFLELVERDCAALWWYTRARRPGVDLESFGNPYFPALRDYYTMRGRDVRVLDITSDFGIPAFAALSRNLRSARSEFLFGCGAHFDANVALGRALTEMNQFLGRSKRILKPKAKDQKYMAPDYRQPLKKKDDYKPCKTIDVRDDVLRCVELARKLGMETLVLDQTRKDIGLPVVKVVAPGLRQFWRRLGKGRLFDAPVKLGWIRRPLKEGELNPDSLVV